jgi:hypothetical protein
MRTVALITPDNIAFTKLAAVDCLTKGDAPVCLQLINVVGLTDEEVSAVGETVKEWQSRAEAVVVYDNLGVTEKMQTEIDALVALGKAVEQRAVAQARMQAG